TLPGTPLIDFAGGTVQVFDSNGVLKSTCTPPVPMQTVSGDTFTFQYNLTHMQLSCPFMWQTGDSIDWRIFYRVRQDWTHAAAPDFIDFAQGYYASDSSGVEEICERWHGTPLEVYDPSPTISLRTSIPCSGWGGSHRVWTRCEPMWMKAGLTMNWNMNCWGCSYFPDEYREYTDVEAIKLVLPEGLSFVPSTSHFATFLYGQDISIPDPTISGDTLIFTDFGTWMPGGFSGCGYRRDMETVYFQILPECTYQLQTYDSVKAWVTYDEWMDSPDQMVTVQDSFWFEWLEASFPTYDVTALNNIAVGVSDTAEWVIDIHNTDLNYATAYNYLYFEDNYGTAGDIQIVEAWHGNSQLNVQQFTSSRSLVELDSIAPNGDEQFRIRFTYNTCSYDSIRMAFGFACGAYPDSASAGWAAGGGQFAYSACTSGVARYYWLILLLDDG
ncbi:MAG: hypothetical protein AAF570_21305, partial [Bacteroidota bacterium]